MAGCADAIPEPENWFNDEETTAPDWITEVGTFTVADEHGCQEQCDKVFGCQSFAFCDRNDGNYRCYLKDKKIWPKDTSYTRRVPGCHTGYRKDCKKGAFSNT